MVTVMPVARVLRHLNVKYCELPVWRGLWRGWVGHFECVPVSLLSVFPDAFGPHSSIL